uniref:Uncharacterized protein n=1 Tax=Solanum lycopersicum TaxID=4081 RepID=A0A3Q7I1Z2_SOLLC
MKTYTETKVYTMIEDESWQLFVKKAEDNVYLEHIQPFAKAIARECGGLPLAIAVMGLIPLVMNTIQVGFELAEISHIKISTSLKRISFVSYVINNLPDCFMECPKTTFLLLQDNYPLLKIPHELFFAFASLIVLNLNEKWYLNTTFFPQ